MEKFGIEIKWAAIITLFLCVWDFVENRLGWHKDFSMIIVATLLQYVFFIVLLFLAFLDKKNNYYNKQWTFKEALTFGIFLTGLLTILNPLAQYIIYQSISPNYFDNLIEYQLAKGRSTREELLQIHNMELKIREGVMNTLSMGVIFTGLFAFILKNKPHQYESTQHTTNKTLR